MANPDSSAVDEAIIGILASDAELTTLMPDGVGFDVGQKNALRHVVVSLMDHDDERQLGGKRAHETSLYLVKVVALGRPAAEVKRGAKRIDELLDGARPTIAGYQVMRIRRVKRVRYSQPDPNNNDLSWQHRGGQYEVMVSVQN